RTNEGDRSQYYLRSGDNFVVMSPAVLRAMFYPRAVAAFEITADLYWYCLDPGAAQRPHSIMMALAVSLKNLGDATAKDVTLRFEAKIGTEPIQVSMQPDWQRNRDIMRRVGPIHPGMPPVEVFTAQWMEPAQENPFHDMSDFIPICEDLAFRF